MYVPCMSRRTLVRCTAVTLVVATLSAWDAAQAAGRTSAPLPAVLLGPAPPVTVGADQVTLLRSGPLTFARLRSLIDGALVSVHVEIYEFGQPGLAAALISAQRRGVAVTVIDDPS